MCVVRHVRSGSHGCRPSSCGEIPRGLWTRICSGLVNPDSSPPKAGKAATNERMHLCRSYAQIVANSLSLSLSLPPPHTHLRFDLRARKTLCALLRFAPAKGSNATRRTGSTTLCITSCIGVADWGGAGRPERSRLGVRDECELHSRELRTLRDSKTLQETSHPP